MKIQRLAILTSPNLVAVDVSLNGKSLKCSGLYVKPDSQYQRIVTLYCESHQIKVEVPPDLKPENLGVTLNVVSIASSPSA